MGFHGSTLEVSLEGLFLCGMMFCSNKAKDEKKKAKKESCFLLAAPGIPKILGSSDTVRVLILTLLR